MITRDEMRAMALALPEVEEKAHFEQPDFRVRGKIFAGLSRDLDRGTLKLTPEVQAMVIEGHGAAFFPAAGAWGRHGWTHVELAHVERGELQTLLIESYQLIAPKQLAGSVDSRANSKVGRDRARPPVKPSATSAKSKTRSSAKKSVQKKTSQKPISRKKRSNAKPR